MARLDNIWKHAQRFFCCKTRQVPSTWKIKKLATVIEQTISVKKLKACCTYCCNFQNLVPKPCRHDACRRFRARGKFMAQNAAIKDLANNKTKHNKTKAQTKFAQLVIYFDRLIPSITGFLIVWCSIVNCRFHFINLVYFQIKRNNFPTGWCWYFIS